MRLPQCGCDPAKMASKRRCETPPLLDLKTIELELMERVRGRKRRRHRAIPTSTDISLCPSRLDSTDTDSMSSALPEWKPVEPIKILNIKCPFDSMGKNCIDPITVTDSEIELNRLSSTEILKLPRFKHYQPGEKSNVLFVKNLANAVTESDLVSIFGRYHKSEEKEIEYRLMKGKMRGQAFVTFPDVDVASDALQLLHGFVWKGKPIIIQYGRRH